MATDLDTTTFNTPNGYVTTGFNTLIPEPLPQDISVSVVIRSDNRIVMGGYSQYSTGSYITLSCYNTDGSLYTAFGVGGKVLLPAPSSFFTSCIVHDVILQPNDYIIVTGDTSSVDPLFPPPVYPLRPSMFVARFTPLGNLDTTTFNSPDGYVIIPPSSFNSGGNSFDKCYSNSVIIQPSDGYIVLGGSVRRISPTPNKNLIALVRLDTTGILDPGFGTNGNGTVYAGFTALNEDICNCLSIQTDGKIVLGGANFPLTNPNSITNLSVSRFTTSGILDTTTFNTSGASPGWLIIPNFFLNSFDYSSGLGINSIGQIIISGYITKQLSSEKCFGVAAVTSNGILDSSFGTGGQTVLDLSPTYDLTGTIFSSAANALALQSDNKIVITGGFLNTSTLAEGFSLARFNTNGTLDLTFGLAGLGYILSDLVSPNTEIGYAVAIQSDGKVLVGGTALNTDDLGSNRYFILARYFGFPPFPPPTPPFPTPVVVPICFPAGTPVSTDQGIIAIEEINPLINTIHNKPIVAITETITNDDKLVCFERNSLGYNVPNQRTIISMDHGIIYNKRMIRAKHFVGKIRGVYFKQYNGEFLYNVLMEKHYIMLVNGLRVETLNPRNMVAKLYSPDYSPEEKTAILSEINAYSSNKNNEYHKKQNDYKSYGRIVVYNKTRRNYEIHKYNPLIHKLHFQTKKNYSFLRNVNTNNYHSLTRNINNHNNTIKHYTPARHYTPVKHYTPSRHNIYKIHSHTFRRFGSGRRRR